MLTPDDVHHNRTQSVLKRGCIEAHKPADRGCGPKRARIRRPEKTKPSLSANANVTGDIDTQGNGEGEVAAGNAAATLGMRERCG